jgi:hypothetical protein
MKRLVIVLAIVLVAGAIVVTTIFFLKRHNDITMGGINEEYSHVVHSIIAPDSELSLNFAHYKFGGTPPFALDRFALSDEHDIQSVYELLRTQVNAEFVRERYIVIRTNIPDLQYVMIARSARTEKTLEQEITEGRSWFDIMPMQGRFFDQDVFALSFWQIQGDSFVVDVPYHLFDDFTLFYVTDAYDYDFHGIAGNFDLSHQIGHYYRIYGNVADFRAFYEKLGLYEITETDDQLILVSSAHTMVLSFQEEDGQRYVAFSFELN